MSRVVWAALALSLAANVFLGGFVIGRLAGSDHHGHGRGPHRMMMFHDLDALSETERAAFRAAFKSRRATFGESFAEMRKARDNFALALAAEPFDRVRAVAALEALQAAQREHEAKFGTLIIDAFEDLSPESRKALIEARDARRHHRRGRRDPGEAMEPPSPAE